MYINGVLTATVPNQAGRTVRTLPADAQVIAWEFRTVLNPTYKFFSVAYDNGWSSSDYQCWKCTGTDVTQQNWADIGKPSRKVYF